MHHAPSAFLLVCALLLALSMPGRAPTARASHEATPVGETTFPITADPAACRVEPRSADDLIALWFEDGTPIADLGDPRGCGGDHRGQRPGRDTGGRGDGGGGHGHHAGDLRVLRGR